MNIDEVIKELGDLKVEDIVQNYSKDQLKSFYVDLYGIEPRGVLNKSELAYRCWNFIADEKRTKDLFKNL